MQATYNPRGVKVYVAPVGTEKWSLVHGYAEDSFIGIEDKSNGITSKVGCDGEIIRAVDASRQHTVTISLLQYSTANKYFERRYVADRNHVTYSMDDGMFRLKITDLAGRVYFGADHCWVTKETPVQYGRDSTARQWTLDTAQGTFSAGPHKANEDKERFAYTDYDFSTPYKVTKRS